MIDFTPCKVNKFKAYGGANGGKINVRYNGESYMLKFPPVPKRNKTMSYANSCISEYLACHIFEALGFRTQETLLGTYTDNRGKQKTVVACRDFTAGGKKLIEFAQLKNTCIDSDQNGYGTELNTILQAIDEQKLIPPGELHDFFWEMFIADALLGNFDRHNGNWGILVDEHRETAEIAPIYDCGSCLYPQISEEEMRTVINDETEINARIYSFPASAILENGKKLSYFDFISSLKSEDCTAALKRVCGRLDMERLYQIIEEVPAVPPIQREFYRTMLRERSEKILEYGMKQVLCQEQQLREQDGPRLSM